ncbi:hypothetical protein Dimus_001180, partial [Dionaea muscipula]
SQQKHIGSDLPSPDSVSRSMRSIHPQKTLLFQEFKPFNKLHLFRGLGLMRFNQPIVVYLRSWIGKFFSWMKLTERS